MNTPNQISNLILLIHLLTVLSISKLISKIKLMIIATTKLVAKLISIMKIFSKRISTLVLKTLIKDIAETKLFFSYSTHV